MLRGLDLNSELDTVPIGKDIDMRSITRRQGDGEAIPGEFSGNKKLTDLPGVVASVGAHIWKRSRSMALVCCGIS